MAFIRPITVTRHQCQPYDGDSTIVTCGPVEMHVWETGIENDIIDVTEASLSIQMLVQASRVPHPSGGCGSFVGHSCATMFGIYEYIALLSSACTCLLFFISCLIGPSTTLDQQSLDLVLSTSIQSATALFNILQ